VPESPEESLLIGVDGGATEVKAHEVVLLSPRSAAAREGFALALGPASASILYERARGFRPVPMPAQLLALERGEPAPGGLEGAQARLWIEAAARAIASVAEQRGRTRALVGMCMPGLKTADGRGLAVVRQGPRIPGYLDRLEAALHELGIELAQPVTRLAGDGEACARGEVADAQGALRGLHSAYYVGGGTGIAEALLIEGRVLGFDALAGFVRKAWQMDATGGRIVEDLLSPRGMNAAWAASTGKRLPLAAEDHPERRALAGDARAAGILTDAAEALAGLVLDRMSALRRGFQGAVRITPNTFLERVVIGQRLGALFADPELSEVFREPAEHALARRILGTGDGALRKHYLAGTSLRPDLLAGSLLRAAPAIGAVSMELEVQRERAPPRLAAPWDPA